jgi:hypothetical protein
MTAPLVTPLVLLSEVRGDLNVTSTTDTDNRVRNLIMEESEHLQRVCKRRFDHRVATIKHTPRLLQYGGDLLNSLDLALRHDLVSVTAITNGDSATISSGYTLEPDSNEVKSVIHLDSLGAVSWTNSNDPRNAISATGVWGYGGQFEATSYTVSSGLAADAAATSFVSSSALETGMVLKIESEYLYVSSTSGTTTTVERGYNGSTAATHANATAISRFKPNALVQRLVKRLVAWRLEQVKSPLFGSAVVGDVIFPVATDSMPKDVAAAVKAARLVKPNRVVAV